MFYLKRLKTVLILFSLLAIACQKQLDETNAPISAEAQSYAAECQVKLMTAKQQFKDLLTNSRLEAIAMLEQLNQLSRTLDQIGGKASLYRNVHPDADLRAEADQCQQALSELVTDISLSRELYDRLDRLELANVDPLTQRYWEHRLRDFRRAGVNQPQNVRNKIRELNQKLIELSQQFNRNISEDVRSIALDNVDELAGLPEDYIAAHPPNEQGKIIITTDYPDYLPFMQYAANDQRRLELYTQFRQRGYPQNATVLKELLAKRYEFATLLGYPNYADYVTEDKMIGSAKHVQEFIQAITTMAEPRAAQDYQILLARLQRIQPAATSVGDWQKAYLEDLIKQEQYQLDSRELRKYFEYKKVRDGIFQLVTDLFGVRIEPRTTDVWHPSVEAYTIYENDQPLGYFYLDMHPRAGKYKHAAHFGLQEGIAGQQLPISVLVCNFPGGGDQPGYLEHSDVETMLHEFGHLLHSIFAGQQRWLQFAGISTEWDFVEAPSQMLEEWVWDADTLKTFARNSDGAVIPDEFIARMRAGRDFGRGIWTQQQMFYAAVSLNYYNRDPASFELQPLMVELQQQYSPFAYVPNTHFYASFGHLDGYSAIYYTYMWSLVIAADMFSEFAKNGLRDTATAQRYRRTVLTPGGSKDAAVLVEDFLGRPYRFDAFTEQLERKQP